MPIKYIKKYIKNKPEEVGYKHQIFKYLNLQAKFMVSINFSQSSQDIKIFKQLHFPLRTNNK